MPRIQVNERAVLARAFTQGDAVIQAGEYGQVVDVDPDNGNILFKLDHHHKALDMWDNVLQIDGDDIEATVTPIVSWPRQAAAYADKFSHPAIFAALCIMAGSMMSHTHPATAGEKTHITVMPIPQPRLPASASDRICHDPYVPLTPTVLPPDRKVSPYSV